MIHWVGLCLSGPWWYKEQIVNADIKVEGASKKSRVNIIDGQSSRNGMDSLLENGVATEPLRSISVR